MSDINSLLQKVQTEMERVKAKFDASEGNEDKMALFGIANAANISLYIILRSANGQLLNQAEVDRLVSRYYPPELRDAFRELILVILLAYVEHIIKTVLNIQKVKSLSPEEVKKLQFELTKKFFVEVLPTFEDENLKRVAIYIQKTYFS
jgi:hypothetical protein